MTGTPREQLIAFEIEADEIMGGLSLWKLPYRSVYSAALLATEISFGGSLFNDHSAPDPEKGATLLTRLSYWQQHLSKCSQLIGADVEDALQVLTPKNHDEMAQAFIYSHFCELMPFVHKNNLAVEQTNEGFRLHYQSKTASDFEARDVVLNELGLTGLISHFEYDLDQYNSTARMLPKLDPTQSHRLLKKAYDFHLENVHEAAFMPTSEYDHILNFGYDEFRRVRASMMALATWCLGIGSAAKKLATASRGKSHDHFVKECLEWIAPLLTKKFVFHTIGILSEIPQAKIERILAYFAENPLADNYISGDGYEAPIKSLDDNFLISPRGLHHMIPERNILYALNRLDRNRFNNLVSAELEPSLLIHARHLLNQIPGIETRANVNWKDGEKDGEIDLLAFCKASNTAIQIQAKASIPASGARMNRQVETSTLQAVRQLECFELLDVHEKDTLIQSVFRVNVHQVRWSSGLLSRSSFGSISAWERIDNRATLTLPVLGLLVQHLTTQTEIDLTAIPELTTSIIDEIMEQAFIEWKDDTIDVFGTRIIVPLLKLDHGTISRWRRIIYSGLVS